METQPEQPTNQIKVVTKKAYSIFQKLFCCRCFYCMRADDQSMLTSHIRKQTFQRMIKNFYLESNADTDVLFDPLKFMIIIYLCEDKSIPHRLFQRCRLNPICHQKRNRTDIEFYLPQICNFLVFHEQLKNQMMIEDLLNASRLTFYFAHLYYFYMNSLTKIILKNDTVVFHRVVQFNKDLLQKLSQEFDKKQLIINDWYLKEPTERNHIVGEVISLNIKKYGTIEEDEIKKGPIVQAHDIVLSNYSSIFQTDQEESSTSSFKSTIMFFDDLFKIADDIKRAEPKKTALKKLLRTVNTKLPATVYIPFTKSSSLTTNLNAVRFSNVLNIICEDCRVFSTKQRAPYYICVQTYNPSECLDEQKRAELNKLVDEPISIKLNTVGGSQGIINTRRSAQERFQHDSRSIRSQLLSEHRQSCQTQILHGIKNKHQISNKLVDFSTMKTVHNVKNPNQQKQINYKQKLDLIFGQKEENMRERIKSKSIYSHLKTWNLVHLMVKIGDNLKQQQFALQLIYQFNYIFKLQNLPLLLTPYQVLSMNPDCGILQMVRETVTIDSLFKKMRQQHLGISSLKQFFEAYYVDVHEAKKKFTQSLSAYSLVMYFLQVKDRHNGNIMLHRDGKILHIDFGFLLSNAPGKGVELQKSAPFKLNKQYIEVMDGIDSSYFEQYRKLFFQGFQAAKKHQDRILILVKMMYASHGSAMPCFQKGQQTIKDLQERFNPSNITNDLQLSEHCQRLINLSLDNWATRWYDKWQYWAQGILY